MFLSSCSKREAIINFQDVYIYTSLEDQILIKDVINQDLFDKIYYTPQPELKYKPVWKTHEDFLDRPNNSKLILISLTEPADTTIDIVAKHISSKMNISENIFSIDDYFNREQILIFLNYDNVNDLNNELINHKDWILSLLNENEKEGMEKVAYRGGINEGISSIISKEFDVSIRVPIDYQILKNDSLDNYLWIGRGYPYRWILIFEDDKNYYKNPASSWSRLEDRFSSILEVDISDYGASFTSNPIRIEGVYGTKLNADNNTGGPFFSNVIGNYKRGKVLVASGFVNFPGKSKIFHIKELEYILNDIKYKDK